LKHYATAEKPNGKGKLHMETMSEEEIRGFIEEWTWGTIIAVNGDELYAIEVSCGSDGKYIYCDSRPDGIMAKRIKANHNVIYKICDADKYYPSWRAVSVFGKAERLTKREDMLYAMRTIAKRVIHAAKKTTRTEKEFEKIGGMLAANPETSSAIRIPIENFTGRKSGWKYSFNIYSTP
jgi:nitroimidazol reductase NimA-like FMN-containing flavoprotein (pyridoxamine 5'-phosphate oxidase superfamily)